MVLRLRLEFPSAPHASVTIFGTIATTTPAPPTKRLLFHPADARNHAPYLIRLCLPRPALATSSSPPFPVPCFYSYESQLVEAVLEAVRLFLQLVVSP